MSGTQRCDVRHPGVMSGTQARDVRHPGGEGPMGDVGHQGE